MPILKFPYNDGEITLITENKFPMYLKFYYSKDKGAYGYAVSATEENGKIVLRTTGCATKTKKLEISEDTIEQAVISYLSQWKV